MMLKKTIILILLFSTNFIFAQFTTKQIKLDEVVIKSKVKLPDLYIHKIKIDTLVKTGFRIIPKVAIGNKGNTEADGQKWGWYLYINDDLVSFSKSFSQALKEGTVRYHVAGYNKKYGSYIFDEPGIYTYKVIIKTKRKFKEFDKTNNIREGTITVTE